MPGFSFFEPSYAVAAGLLISVRTKIPLGVFRDAAPDTWELLSSNTGNAMGEVVEQDFLKFTIFKVGRYLYFSEILFIILTPFLIKPLLTSLF